MWKLTVKRFYTLDGDYKLETSDEVHFESDNILELAEIVDRFRDYGVGKYTYTITLEEEA